MNRKSEVGKRGRKDMEGRRKKRWKPRTGIYVLLAFLERIMKREGEGTKTHPRKNGLLIKVRREFLIPCFTLKSNQEKKKRQGK